ncbi:hypothetical protein HYY71_03125 [Candidatus Woesearchaeota archaeon]|nr:hypothetical protein [Candidatus Woesearchaeota archaeon]
MRVVIAQKHLSLNKRLARESNGISKKFSVKNYSKIENIDALLLKRDISVERKKGILIKKLHEAVLRAFSIDKGSLNKKAFALLKKRIYNIRKVINKLRSINYYLETVFLEDLSLSNIKMKKQRKLKQRNALARDELEALEYTAYKLIGEVVTLDKRLLREYSQREKTIVSKEKIEIRDIEPMLRKESEILEHIEAKLPPPRAAGAALIKEPVFTHWIARIFSLLSYLEHIHSKELILFSKLKKNKKAKMMISKKINQLLREKSKLVGIMEEKFISMRRLDIDSGLKKDIHNLTTIINL